MGSNKRYPGHGIERAIDYSMVRPEPIGLTEQELDLEHNPARRPREPIEVKAWVRYREVSIQPRGRAIAFTDKAVLVEYEEHGGRTMRVWVWASSVDRV